MKFNIETLIEQGAPLLTQYGPRVLGALFFLFVAWILAGWVGRLTGRGLRRANVDITLAKFLSKLARWLVLILSFVGCLGIFNVNTTSFAAILGAAGLAIGLAFQGTLSNFAAGAMLLFFRPYDVGDVVNVGGQTGKVDEIGLFTTTIDTPDNRRIIIPNGTIFGGVIENITHHDTRRVDVPVGVGYTADIDRTREVLSQAADNVQGRLDDPEPAIILCELGGSSVDWQVRVWAKTEEYWDVRQATIRSVKVALDSAEIEIPFPQMDVHLDSPVST